MTLCSRWIQFGREIMIQELLKQTQRRGGQVVQTRQTNGQMDKRGGTELMSIN